MQTNDESAIEDAPLLSGYPLLNLFAPLIVAAANMFLGLSPALAERLEEKPGRPNIVLILADDLGYRDLARISHNAVWFAVDFRDRFFVRRLRFLAAACSIAEAFLFCSAAIFSSLVDVFRLQRARGARAGEKRFVFESSGVVSR